MEVRDVPILDLKVSYEADWLKNWVLTQGDSVAKSPHYLYLRGNPLPQLDWMKARNLPIAYVSAKLMEVLLSLIKNGQTEPIKIYRNMQICTGHKRSACMLYLGYKTIKAEIVADNYKF